MKLSFAQKAAVVASAWHYRRELQDLLIRRYWQKRKEMVVIVDGVRVVYDTSDFLSNILLYQTDTPGIYEPEVSRILARLIKSTSVFADVGANLGYFTVLAAAVNPQCKVYSFEIDATLKPVVQRNMKINGINEDQVEIVNAAAGDTGGEVKYHLHPAGFLAMRERVKLEPYAMTFSSPMVRMDDFFSDKPAPDLWKIDVDGAELHVLRGMTQLLEARPTMLLEVHYTVLPKYNASMSQVFDFLKPYGYRYQLIDGFRADAGFLRDIENFEELKTKSGDMLLLTHT